MKYLLIDTNIYLDLLFFRTKHNPPESHKYLLDLLKWDTSKLLVPEIVKTEVYRNAYILLEQSGKNVKDIIKRLESSFWLNDCMEASNDYSNKIKEICEKLNEYKNLHDQKKGQLKAIVEKLLDSIFSHKNTIIIKNDMDIIPKIIKRRIFKECPFHSGKDAYADAIIVETLVNITKYIKLEQEDKVYFVSRNFEDFSESKEEREKLHSQIQQELKNNNLEDNIYYSIYFFRTLKTEFEVEYITAKQLEKEYEDYLVEIGDNMWLAEAEQMEALEDYYNH